jgi:hypothetical protein
MGIPWTFLDPLTVALLVSEDVGYPDFAGSNRQLLAVLKSS